MKGKRFLMVILLSFFTFILLTPFYENLSKRNEANASEQKAQVSSCNKDMVSRQILNWC